MARICLVWRIGPLMLHTIQWIECWGTYDKTIRSKIFAKLPKSGPMANPSWPGRFTSNKLQLCSHGYPTFKPKPKKHLVIELSCITQQFIHWSVCYKKCAALTCHKEKSPYMFYVLYLFALGNSMMPIALITLFTLLEWIITYNTN